MPFLLQDLVTIKPIICTHAIKECTYFNPGRSLTLAVISAASGTSFSTNSRGPQNDLFCPRKVFLAKKQKERKYEPGRPVLIHHILKRVNQVVKPCQNGSSGDAAGQALGVLQSQHGLGGKGLKITHFPPPATATQGQHLKDSLYLAT